MKKENKKLVKRSKVIVQQPKTTEDPNTVDIKSVIVTHPKTSHRLFKTVKNAQRVGADSFLYSETKKENILNEKYIKITKQSYACRDNASNFHVEILNYFNPELQLKGIEITNRNKLIDLLSELRGFKNRKIALILEFKKIEIFFEFKRRSNY